MSTPSSNRDRVPRAWTVDTLTSRAAYRAEQARKLRLKAERATRLADEAERALAETLATLDAARAARAAGRDTASVRRSRRDAERDMRGVL